MTVAALTLAAFFAYAWWRTRLNVREWEAACDSWQDAAEMYEQDARDWRKAAEQWESAAAIWRSTALAPLQVNVKRVSA